MPRVDCITVKMVHMVLTSTKRKKGNLMTIDYNIYENNVLTTLLVDGGYVSFTKSGTGANATFTTKYLEGKVLFRIFATESGDNRRYGR